LYHYKGVAGNPTQKLLVLRFLRPAAITPWVPSDDDDDDIICFICDKPGMC
jgi:hypothetical protein